MKIKELMHIESSFFELDEINRLAKVTFGYKKPEDIFDSNHITKTPILSAGFMSQVKQSFDLVPSKYKIDMTVVFDDMGTYTEDALGEIFKNNIDLEFKSRFIVNRTQKRTAIGLIGIGVAFFVTMMLIAGLWKSDSIWRDIVVYVSDIAATVTIWEAMTILVVKQKEESEILLNLKKRFSSISFVGKSGENDDHTVKCVTEQIGASVPPRINGITE